MLEQTRVHCPCCGEIIELLVDCSAGDHQSYIEDCQVCCQPMRLDVLVSTSGELASVTATAEQA